MSDVQTVDPPSRAKTDPVNLHALLDEVFADLEVTLRDIPGQKQDLQDFLNARLRFELKKNEVQALVNLALDELGTLRTVVFKALTLWVVARRIEKELFTPGDIDPPKIDQAMSMLPQLSKTVEAIEDELRSQADNAGAKRGLLITQLTEHLLPSQALLKAAQAVGPRLADFGRATHAGKTSEVLPSASEQDMALLACAFQGVDDSQRASARLCLCTLVLLETINADLVAWETLSRVEVGSGPLISARKALAENLTRDKQAYDYTFARLQRQQEAALKGEKKSLASGLRRIQGHLFAMHLKLVAIQRQIAASPINDEVVKMEPQELQRLLAECALEAGVPKQQDPDEGREEQKQLYREALQKSGEAFHQPEFLHQEVPQGSPRRLVILIGLMAILAVATVVSYVRLLSYEEPPDVRVPLAELSGEMPLQDAMVVGGLMYAKVPAGAWRKMSKSERIEKLTALGAEAADRGCSKVYLTDERTKHLATWTDKDGVQFGKPPQQ